MTSGDLHADLAVRLRVAHRQIASLDAPPEGEQRTSDTSNSDAARASERLDALLADLDAELARSPHRAPQRADRGGQPGRDQVGTAATQQSSGPRSL